MSRRRGSTAAAASSSGSPPPAGELGERGPGAPAAVGAAVQQAVHLEAHREPVRRGAGQPGALTQLGQPARLGRGRPEHPHGFVEHADAARLSHRPILTSHDIGTSSGRSRTADGAHAGREGLGPARGPQGARAEPDLLYIDLHLVHEVTSPQAFDGLRLAGRPVRRPDLTLATEDHNVPTLDVLAPIADPVSRTQVETLRAQLRRVRRPALPDEPRRAGHRARRRPAARADPAGHDGRLRRLHTSTHGAFGALAFGIGTSEVEHVLATQTLPLKPFKTMAINVNVADGRLRPGVTSKDIMLAVIAQIGTGGGQGYVLEYRGDAIENLSMEARMTICNMSIEAGARAGMIAPDDTTFAYLKGRDHAPQGELWDEAVASWRALRTDDDAVFDAEVHIDADALTPFVTWGTNPGQGLPLCEPVPDPARDRRRERARRRREGAGLHGPRRRARRCATSPSTPCSSARAPTAGSRTCAPPPTCSTGRQRRRRRADAGGARLDAGAVRRPRPRAWTRCSPRPAPSGAPRAARCAWA